MKEEWQTKVSTIGKEAVVSSLILRVIKVANIIASRKAITPPYAPNLKLYCERTVFPLFMRSTRLLIKVLEGIRLRGKKILDMGTGLGILAIFCAKRNASEVYGSDINREAIKMAKINAKINHVEIEFRHGDLFAPFGGEQFELILFNPPFFPKSPKNDRERSIFAGRNYHVIKKFLRQLPSFLSENGISIVTFSTLMDLTCLRRYIKQSGLVGKQVGKIMGLPKEEIIAYLIKK